MRVFYWVFLQFLVVAHLVVALSGIAWGVCKVMLWMLSMG